MNDRLWGRIEKTEGCWLWKGSTMTSGYGQIRWGGKVRPVHRVVWELLRGSVPAEKQLDHLCRNHICANPAHLECVSQKENVLRGVGPSAMNARKTHCPKGHPYAPENIQNRKDGQRRCKQCHRERCRQYRLRSILSRLG